MLRILLLISFIPIFLTAQVIGNIDVYGEKSFTRSEYLQFGGVKPGDKFFLSIADTIKKRILLNLTDNGYFDAVVNISTENSLEDSARINIKIDVKEINPALVRNIFFEGVNKTDSLIFSKNFEYIPGNIFSKGQIEECIENFLSYAEESGYPFASIKIKSINLVKDSLNSFVDIYLNYSSGDLSRIDKIVISGNTSTKGYVILRDARINIGTNYSQKEIDEIPQRLDKLRFFEPVEEPLFYFNADNQGVLQLNVKEKQTNNFDGLIGYVPGSSTQNGYVTGLVNISLRNIFGTGRAAAIHWQKIDRNSQDMELKYLEPWIFNYPFNLNFSFFQLKQDTSYVQRKLDGAIEFLANENISASFLLSTEAVIPTESLYSIFTVYNSSIITTGFSLKIDTRDDFYSPTEGIFFSNSYSLSRKKINGPEEFITADQKRKINLQRFAVDFNIYEQLLKRQVVAVSLHGREIRSSFYEISDLYKFGGTNTLRGYRENQFLANRLLWSNVEYRLLLTRRSFTFLFYDIGYYLRNEDAERKVLRTSAVKMGYGLGLNIETGLGVLSVSYALAKGDTFSDGKIHFGIINEF